MDFFGRQERARRSSRWLVAAFVLAVVLVVAAVDAVLLLMVGLLTGEPGAALFSPTHWMERHPRHFWTTTLGVAGTIIGASLWKIGQLGAGGHVVAADLGARPVTGDTGDPLERRLLNIVEEMAIASGVPVPAVYVLESRALNALAAGYAPSAASLVVTRGTLKDLDRAELQGVVGHEFSHILNGDMRLNTRLVGFLHGLFIVSELGRMLNKRRSNDYDPRASLNGWPGIAAFAIFVIGLGGLFVGRLLQSAVSRQRERLADASAIQFTRESRGLRNALVKMGAHKAGSRLHHHGIDRVCHMLFAPAGVLDFATHPPLVERIRALDPSFKPAEFGEMRRLLDARDAAEAAASPPDPDPLELGALLATAVPADPAAIAGLVGNPGPLQVQFAEGVRGAMPAAVKAAAADSASARALLLALAIGPKAPGERLAYIGQQLGPGVAEQVRAAGEVARTLPVIQRLPAVLLLMAPLRNSVPAERRALVTILNGLMTRGGDPSVFGYALRKCAMTFLLDGLRSPGSIRQLSLRAVREDLRVVLGIVAHNGAANSDEARRAFDIGWAQLGLPPAFPGDAALPWVRALDRAIARLDRLAPHDKERVVRALTVTVAHDARINVAEAELLRLFCAQLHCPLPPLLSGP